MKKIYITLFALLLGSAAWAQAQTGAPEEVPALETAPPALGSMAVKTPEPQANSVPAAAPFSRKPQFSLGLGSQFSRYGHAAYVQPTMVLPLTSRFRAFTGLQVRNTFGPGFYAAGAESNGASARPQHQVSYLAVAGGQYDVNAKLTLTGSIWRDFAGSGNPNRHLMNPYFAPGSTGMSFRAHFKINDQLSVSGGLRYGNNPGYRGGHSYMYQDYNSPFGL